MTAIPLEDEVYYPESDGEPVAESELHMEELVYVWEALKDRFQDDPDVFVGANMFLYYRRGDPRSVVAPDGFVVQGVPKRLPGNRRRKKYLLWEEGKPPCFVLETTSDSTRREDLHTKKSVYEHLGVDEYFLFDPLGDYLKPQLQGYRLVQGHYQPIPPSPDGSLHSQATGVLFRSEGPHLRLTDATRGIPLLRTEEIAEARRQAERRAADEAEARRQAERRAVNEAEARRQAEEKVRDLEEEIARLRRLQGT